MGMCMSDNKNCCLDNLECRKEIYNIILCLEKKFNERLTNIEHRLNENIEIALKLKNSK